MSFAHVPGFFNRVERIKTVNHNAKRHKMKCHNTKKSNVGSQKIRNEKPGDCNRVSSCSNLRAFSCALFFPVYSMDSLVTAAFSFTEGFAFSFWE